MKALNYIILGIFAVAIGVLYYLHFTSCKSCSSRSPRQSGAALSGSGVSIAYVNIDTLEEKYEFFKQKKAELEKRQKSIESILQKDAENLQREVYDLQQRAQFMTQSEGEAAQEKLMRKQYDLEAKQSQFGESLMSEKSKFNEELNQKLDSFLTEYNSDRKFTYVVTYAKGGFILYKDEAYDITSDVIEGMNAKFNEKK